jgi:antibiotic biosynthesis monooxygenase (ABM) superfamily enzyme
MKLAVLFPKILISILILGYLRIIISKSSLINEVCKCIIRNYILITLFITYFTKESLNKIDDERKEAENKVVL